MIHLEDRIQSGILSIWGVLIHPNQVNISEFSSINFVCVGVGPLSFDSKYVKKGTPVSHIHGGVKFMAEHAYGT
jgi:hypothetical protein